VANDTLTAADIEKARDLLQGPLDKSWDGSVTAQMWAKEFDRQFSTNLRIMDVLKNTEEDHMQPTIALVGGRESAKQFLEATVAWSQKVEIMLPQIRVISEIGQAQPHFIVGYVMVDPSPLSQHTLNLILEEVMAAGRGEAPKRYDDGESFRRAMMALRILPSQVGAPSRISVPIPGA